MMGKFINNIGPDYENSDDQDLSGKNIKLNKNYNSELNNNLYQNLSDDNLNNISKDDKFENEFDKKNDIENKYKKNQISKNKKINSKKENKIQKNKITEKSKQKSDETKGKNIIIKFFDDIVNWLFSICIAIIFVFLLKTFIGMPTTVTGSSMNPTFYTNDKLLLSTFSASFHKTPERGSIVTFEAPNVEILKNNDQNFEAIYYQNSKTAYQKLLYEVLGISDKSYIKRVIGVEGDHIEIKNGSVYINGSVLDEKYLPAGTKTDMSLGGLCSDVIVPKGYIFVLGDNRSKSADSRRFGCIPVEKIQGKAILRWWPLKKITII